MIERLFVFFVAVIVIGAGWREVVIANNYKEPVKMSCQDLLKAASKPAWVSVDDCVVYLGHYQTTYDKDNGTLKGMWVMLFPSMAAAEDDKVKTSVALEISNSERRNTIDENLKKLNQLTEDKSEAAQKEAKERYRKLFETGPLILKEDVVNEELDLIKDRLEPQHMTYAYSSLDDKSTLWQGGAMMAGGVVACLLVLRSILFRHRA